MRASVLVLSLALGVPACVGYEGADAPPPDWIALPPGVADRMFLDRVRATLHVPQAQPPTVAGSCRSSATATLPSPEAAGVEFIDEKRRGYGGATEGVRVIGGRVFGSVERDATRDGDRRAAVGHPASRLWAGIGSVAGSRYARGIE
jgi:hypothetical protein